MSYCEDYPCCGHTPQDPCEPQWYDAPDAFDTRVNPHALCDHENGDCNVEPEEDDTLPCGCSEGMCYCEPEWPEDEGYYYSGTGEWSEDSSYEDYLNR